MSTSKYAELKTKIETPNTFNTLAHIYTRQLDFAAAKSSTE